MIPLKKAFNSTVGRKFVMGLSGLALVGFMILHLAGNILLYSPDPTLFNLYGKAMMDKGVLLWIAEIGLLGLFLGHIVTGLQAAFHNRRARPVSYRMHKPKKGTHPTNRASRFMALTGLLLMVFLPIHVMQFRFGPGMEAGYAAMTDGEQIRDLYGLVQETFQNPYWVLFYCATIGLLFVHLRHGFWSAFQSLGAAHPRWSRAIYGVAFVFAALLAAGFFFMPLWFYFDIPGRLL